MIWLYIALAVVFGIPLTMFVVGMFLPERYEAHLAFVLNRSPDEVWAAMMDVSANPITGKMHKKTERLPDVNDLPSWKEDMGSSQVTVTTDVSEPGSRVRRRLVDSVVPMTAEWTVELAAVPDGCRVKTTNVTVIRRGTWHVPFFRVMIGLFGGFKMGIRDYWKRLSKNLGANLRMM